MKLMLSIINVDRLDNNASTRLVLDRHGAQIGRAPTANWSLPDPKNYISFNHCEIDYVRGQYVLTDRSTNGTFVNGAHERMAGPHTLADGDEITIGHYRVRANLSDDRAAPEPPNPHATPENNGWTWEDTPQPQREDPAWNSPLEDARAPFGRFDPPPADPRATPQWNPNAPAAAITGRGAASENFLPPRALPDSSGDDVWGRFADSNRVNWDHGGFAQEQVRDTGWPAPQPSAPPPPQPAPRRPQPAPTFQPSIPQPPALRPEIDADRGGEWRALLEAAGVDNAELRAPAKQSATAAGNLLHKLVAGLVVMLDARARAKRELGAESTMFESQGNNPLKFQRIPEAALTKLLNPPERGFMDAERAVEDAFKDLQAHQMATLAAMQGALRATLTRFSPQAIRSRADANGLLARILPGARASALWDAYEREFEGVVKGSDEAFMDVFAKAFREAYQKACREMRR